MIIKAIETEWFQDYKVPSMYIAFPNCSFKCEKDCGKKLCQNSYLAQLPNRNVDADSVVKEYLRNPITQAVVCGGLEPFDSFCDLTELIFLLRRVHHCDDTIVIYTGYTQEELGSRIEILKHYKNIVIKFGRFVPGQTSHYDEILETNLASDNQYAIQIS